ncbi:hypothetical protein bplSymb_SCF00705P018 [Bathymodiolus platifrons methanotrophic gill symbiont]|nr:hypothetical protein bplSymb_SCF00705P018 [Bathymodiolus platifrons methanotrophic gill symbiont]
MTGSLKHALVGLQLRPGNSAFSGRSGGLAILEQSPYTLESRSNWRQRVKKVVPEYGQARGRWSGISRGDVARASKRAFDGITVGQFRQEDDLIPIVLRHQESERVQAATNIDMLQVLSPFAIDAVPLAQVTKSVEVAWEDPVIWRWDRRRAITVQASPKIGVTTPTLRDSVLSEFNAIKLPPGYKMDWDGEYDTSKESQDGLKPGMVPALIIMVFII